MVAWDERTALEVVFLIVVPAVVGLLLTRFIGDEAKRRGWPPPRVRGARLLITIVWASFVVAGTYVALGPFSFLSTLTVSAIAGIAASLALQTTLQNVVAGYVLFRRSFLRLGDEVQISGVQGRIVSIGIITTVLRLEDGSLGFVSNSNMLSGPLVNRTAGKRLAGEY